jgi:hypothetical protein
MLSIQDKNRGSSILVSYFDDVVDGWLLSEHTDADGMSGNRSALADSGDIAIDMVQFLQVLYNMLVPNQLTFLPTVNALNHVQSKIWLTSSIRLHTGLCY